MASASNLELGIVNAASHRLGENVASGGAPHWQAYSTSQTSLPNSSAQGSLDENLEALKLTHYITAKCLYSTSPFLVTFCDRYSGSQYKQVALR